MKSILKNMCLVLILSLSIFLILNGCGSDDSENVNHPPNTPSDPIPAAGAVDVAINNSLSWTGGDPDAGDTVWYDVHLGLGNTMSRLSYHQLATSYDLQLPLLNDTTYSWRIVCFDRGADTTYGPIWSFETIAAPTQ